MKHAAHKKQVWQPDLKAIGTTTVGERGQVVIPANVRRRAGLRAGDKMVVFVHPAGPLFMMPIKTMKGFVSHLVKRFGSIKS
jgi:AbrB family looped-hinge helix DNA binding protein